MLSQIKEACAQALPGIQRAAEGSEPAVYNLRFVIADLLDALLRDGAIVGALAAKGIRVERDLKLPAKFAWLGDPKIDRALDKFRKTFGLKG